MTKPFTLITPQNPIPLIFDSPHSGTEYPDDFDYACDFKILERAEDKYVEDLFENAPNHGAPLLYAHFPRSYIDVNRCEKDIDHDLLEDIWPEESQPTARSQAGIGLIRRLAKPGIPVYNRSLTSAEIQHRIETYFHPYHKALEDLIESAHQNYGQVWHINCHSMPAHHSFAMSGIFSSTPFRSPDFVLGNLDGTSCALTFTHAVRDFIKSLGYKVTINDPYKGVELVRRYSDPALGRHSLQIEINKALYMDEETGQKTKNYNALKDDIDRLIGFLAEYVRAQMVPLAAD